MDTNSSTAHWDHSLNSLSLLSREYTTGLVIRSWGERTICCSTEREFATTWESWSFANISLSFSSSSSSSTMLGSSLKTLSTPSTAVLLT